MGEGSQFPLLNFSVRLIEIQCGALFQKGGVGLGDCAIALIPIKSIVFFSNSIPVSEGLSWFGTIVGILSIL